MKPASRQSLENLADVSAFTLDVGSVYVVKSRRSATSTTSLLACLSSKSGPVGASAPVAISGFKWAQGR